MMAPAEILKRWWWLIATFVAVIALDRVIHRVYAMCTDNDAVVRGEAVMEALDDNDDIGLWVIGDSSGRWGVNTNILSSATGVPSWNLATFHGAFPSQVTLLDRAIAQGRAPKAILIVHTENGQAKYIAHEGPEITLAYFHSPHAIRFWYERDLIDLSGAADWTWALLCNSFRDGKGLERFVLELEKTPMKTLQQRWDHSEEQYREHFENRGHSRGTGLPGPGLGEFDYFIQVILESPGYKFENHKDVDEWNERLLRITDEHGIKVFFALTPRMEKILRHPKWPTKVGDPVRRWAAELQKRHPSFELLAPDPFPAKADEFHDTADHLNAKGAERYSKWIAKQLVGRL